MKNQKILCLFWFVFFANIIQLKAQYIRIENIEIIGYKKTKLKTIFRELTLQHGDSILIEELPAKLKKCEQNLMNVGVFSQASVNVKKWDTAKNTVDIIITLRESWYIFPFANVSIADRNFNVWWDDKNRDLRRLYYTGGVSWNNTTGRADRLRVYGMLGYGQKINVIYNLPNLGKNNNIGLFFYTNYRQNKEIWYATRNDSLQFFQDDSQISQKNIEIDGGIAYRYKINTTHRFKLRFDYNSISDAALALNPKYFGKGRNERRYWSMEYNYIYDLRNFRPYPTKGFMGAFWVEKQGILPTDNVNALYLTGTFVQYIQFSKKLSLELYARARYEMSGNEQPYLNSRALGFGKDYLRGYEYFVIDGTRFGYLKSSWHYQIFNKRLSFGELVPLSSRYLPLRIYAAINNDVGKVFNPFAEDSNKLVNRWLYGRGIGLDFHAYYGTVFQLQYSRNVYNKGSFFFHLKTFLDQ
jgi:outer membrane protein assembly factor BamA